LRTLEASLLPETTYAQRPAATCHCRFASIAPLHHDLLLNVEVDVAVALELLELATTWEELDYSGAAVIPPSDWLDFAAAHTWRDPELAARLFSVAIDVVSRSPEPVRR
jgi:hypothetical protein